jgi:hypothetical protein
MAPTRKKPAPPSTPRLGMDEAKTHVQEFINALNDTINSHYWLDTSPSENDPNATKTFITIVRKTENADLHRTFTKHAKALNALKTHLQNDAATNYGKLTAHEFDSRFGTAGIAWQYDSELAKIGTAKHSLAGITLRIIKPEEGNWVRLELTGKPAQLAPILPPTRQVQLGSTGLPQPQGKGENRFHAENIVTMMHNIQLKPDTRLLNHTPTPALNFPSSMRADLIAYLEAHNCDKNNDFKIEERPGQAPLLIMAQEKLSEVFGQLPCFPPQTHINPNGNDHDAPSQSPSRPR